MLTEVQIRNNNITFHLERRLYCWLSSTIGSLPRAAVPNAKLSQRQVFTEKLRHQNQSAHRRIVEECRAASFYGMKSFEPCRRRMRLVKSGRLNAAFTPQQKSPDGYRTRSTLSTHSRRSAIFRNDPYSKYVTPRLTRSLINPSSAAALQKASELRHKRNC